MEEPRVQKLRQVFWRDERIREGSGQSPGKIHRKLREIQEKPAKSPGINPGKIQEKVQENPGNSPDVGGAHIATEHQHRERKAQTESVREGRGEGANKNEREGWGGREGGGGRGRDGKGGGIILRNALLCPCSFLLRAIVPFLGEAAWRKVGLL